MPHSRKSISHLPCTLTSIPRTSANLLSSPLNIAENLEHRGILIIRCLLYRCGCGTPRGTFSAWSLRWLNDIQSPLCSLCQRSSSSEKRIPESTSNERNVIRQGQTHRSVGVGRRTSTGIWKSPICPASTTRSQLWPSTRRVGKECLQFIRPSSPDFCHTWASALAKS
jgi:hypothetical protein